MPTQRSTRSADIVSPARYQQQRVEAEYRVKSEMKVFLPRNVR